LDERGTTILVPIGTQIVDVDTNEVVIDMDEDDVKFLLLEGGQGGKGNKNFISAMNHSPKESTRGLPGNTMLAQFELKTIADCGLVGFPNAGKSSILGAVSTSKPKVASYPFTTLQPFVGHVHDLLGNSCMIADTPGLIEGAYENRGLGHQFLRHLERTSCLAFVIDMYSPHTTGDPGEGPCEPWDVLEILENELELYLPGLSDKGIMIFANKCDYEKDVNGNSIKAKLEELRSRTHLPVYAVSAKTAIERGPYHPVAGLGDPLQFLCEHVFATKAQEKQLRSQESGTLDDELDSIFRSRHRAHFAPVNFTDWRSSVQRKSGASLSVYSSGEGGLGQAEEDADENEEIILGPSLTSTTPPTDPATESFAQRAARLRSKFSQSNPRSSSKLAPLRKQNTPSDRELKLPVIEEEMSLVDQQLGDDISGSEMGVGDRYDAYKHLPERAKLQRLRDASMRGKVWQKTRGPGEKLKDEKWQ
jgi:GTP-binding protein